MAEPHNDSEVAHDVLRTIRQIMKRVAEHSRYLSTEVGLTLPQLMCLKAVGEMEEEPCEEITVANVASRLQLSPATVSRIAERLVIGKLLERTRDDKDRRKVRLSLTNSGLERYQALPVPLQEEFLARLRKLDHSERLELLSALKRLSSLMGAADLEVAPILHEGEVMKVDPPDAL